MTNEQLERFQALAATGIPMLDLETAHVWFVAGEASMQEAAANWCDLLSLHHSDNYRENGGRYDEGRADGADECAQAIRALSQKEAGNGN